MKSSGENVGTSPSVPSNLEPSLEPYLAPDLALDAYGGISGAPSGAPSGDRAAERTGNAKLVFGVPEVPYDLTSIRAVMLSTRDAMNKNNVTRTGFYLTYWEYNKEVAWSLLAHLVSRNAGYAMSDLARYFLLVAGGQTSGPASLLSLPVLPGYGPAMTIRQTFAYLETGNFLIFRDVCPQLMAYAYAKYFCDSAGIDRSVELFELLGEPEFAVDPFSILEWKRFFVASKDAEPRWYGNDPSSAAEPAVVRQSMVTIVNEQNHIEGRLVNPRPGAIPYVGMFEVPIQILMKVMAQYRLTTITFPYADAGSAASDLYLHTVGDFTNLGDRIRTGRALYNGTFLRGSRMRGFMDWAQAGENRVHGGTRQAYDAASYSVDPSTIFPGGRKYSPALVASPGAPAAWPEEPAASSDFALTHATPPALAPWSAQIPPATLAAWLTSPTVDAFAAPIGQVDPVHEGRPLSEIFL